MQRDSMSDGKWHFDAKLLIHKMRVGGMPTDYDPISKNEVHQVVFYRERME